MNKPCCLREISEEELSQRLIDMQISSEALVGKSRVKKCPRTPGQAHRVILAQQNQRSSKKTGCPISAWKSTLSALQSFSESLQESISAAESARTRSKELFEKEKNANNLRLQQMLSESKDLDLRLTRQRTDLTQMNTDLNNAVEVNTP